MNDTEKDAEARAWPAEPAGDRGQEGGAEVLSQFAETSAADPEPIPFEFRGNAKEYFRIWVVNLALTLLTFGLYSPWAKVRKLRYFYGNTYLDGSAFDFLGKPLVILKGRIIAALAFGSYWYAANFHPSATLVLLPLFAVFFPWVMIKALRFRSRNSTFRNLTFSYHGGYWQIAVAYLGLPLFVLAFGFAVFYFAGLLSAFQMGSPAQLPPALAKTVGPEIAAITVVGTLAFPFFLYLQKRALLEPCRFGDTGFAFDCGPKGFYYLFLFMLLLGIVVLAAAFMILWIVTFIHLSGNALAVLNLVVFAVLELFLYVFFITQLRNMVVGALRLGEARLASRLRVGEVFTLYFTNIVGIVLSLGLLIPWAKVRLLRYQMTRTALHAPQGTEGFTGRPGRSANAVGEELAAIFDLDIGI